MSTIKPSNESFTAQPSLFGKIMVYLSFVLIFPIILFIVSRNNFLRLQQSIEETASDIDVQLKRRFDLLTKLVDATKGYMKFEKSTLTDVVSLRSGKMETMSDLSKADSGLNAAFGKFNALLENYPDLKANTTVLQLQSGAKDCEDNIAAARRFYNANVKVFNSKIKTFPSNVVASTLNLVSKDYFLASDSDRQDIKIDL
ncbi:MAG: LemA family protein [Spiroplasma sp. WSS]|uniref:LemA family protein n=1 Tax=unclassified Spiroplasma TaxID=2637901 RepID=UPI0011F6A044|nr:LemA family protein [Spiroplasma endosymbiont of Lariophagus distinguendus]MBP1525986.1 LemA family protein [Spiroplasma ixodetis]TLF28361.1 MAG: LemA family protein [Spiroplasma sp. WSS]WDA54266.1 MAG: LemA family protein [Spiroplasma endosymbiont of Drosophila atripex]MBP1527413.1 LemA family protein [Spiroplasma ixodetis]MBP1528668.1 LemA family protein [Spiroplasma ixodetis]